MLLYHMKRAVISTEMVEKPIYSVLVGLKVKIDYKREIKLKNYVKQKQINKNT